MSTCNCTRSTYMLSYVVVLYRVYHCSHAPCIPVCSGCFGCGVIVAYHFARCLMCSCWHVIVSEWCYFTVTVWPLLRYFALPLDLIDLLYSSRFSWHDIFVHFIIRHLITKVCLLEIRIRMVHGGRVSIGRSGGIFCGKREHTHDFGCFQEVLGLENLRLCGTSLPHA